MLSVWALEFEEIIRIKIRTRTDLRRILFNCKLNYASFRIAINNNAES